MKWLLCLMLVGCVPVDSQPDVQPWIRQDRRTMEEDIERRKAEMGQRRPGFYQMKQRERRDEIRTLDTTEQWTELERSEYHRLNKRGVM